MKVVLREDDSGVSEVVGTILILAMTVVLFASIIVWVTSIPTPVAATRLEIDSVMNPIYNLAGNEIGANITLRHQGGESLDSYVTIIYVTTRFGETERTDILRTRGTVKVGLNAGQPYGLIDGPDDTWNAGERWTLANYTIRPSTDEVVATIVDTAKSIVLWSATLNPPAGTRPPLFVEKWADSIPETAAIDIVETGYEFWVFAKVADPDGDLNEASVYGTLTIFYGTGDSCAQPQRMYDDGTHGDRSASDGVFTLSRTCMRSPSLDWDGSIVLFNATDDLGHVTTSRMVLNVIPGPPGSEGGDNGTGGSGRPQNLRWNGRQGYNIFNASQWDRFKYTAKPTRTFRASEELIVVVGSLDLENSFDTNRFTLYDPFSGYPPQATVYGSDKTVTETTQPSSAQAFSFLEFVNGYYVYRYRFKFNDAPTVGINFERTPSHPPNYFFARYSLDILMTSASGIRFNTTDSVNITDEDGFMRNFPQVQTFADPGFTQEKQTFASTSMVYVQVQMFTVDPVVDPTVVFGNIQIKDYLGGTQLWRAPANGNDVNSPICNVAGTCEPSGSTNAITRDGVLRVYRFAINLTRVDQDPWVEGTQNYALTVTSVRDSDELYAEVSTQLVVTAPLYKLDLAIGNEDTTSNAWGTHDYSYYYENVNGFDRWRKERVEYCGLGGTSCSSLEKTVSVAYLDFDRDGDLDIAGSVFIDNNDARMYLYRRDLDFTGNVIFTRFLLEDQANVYCKSLATGDVTGDGAPEIVCGATNGYVWYYKNDGTWHDGIATKVSVDTTRNQAVNMIAIADFNGDGARDIAVGGASGRLTWYPNLDGLGRFQNTGIVDDWYADGEVTRKGTVISGSYLTTYESDDQHEQIRESNVTEPVQAGGSSNPSFDVDMSPWTYQDWVEPGTAASGARVTSGGNPNGYAGLTTAFVANQVVAGYWYQAFTVSGSPPFTASLSLDRILATFGATGGSITFYAFVDTTSGVPVLGQQVWSSGALTGTTAWVSVPSIDVSSKVPAAGTYYLKIAMRTQNAGSGSASGGGFDNVALAWTSTGGQASELEHYWRFAALPSRPGTTYTLSFEGRHSVNGEGDNFALAYATDVVGNNPTTGTYSTILWVNVTAADQTYSYILPSAVGGKILWLRAIDMDRRVGNLTLDTLLVDRVYIRADTPSGSTGAPLTNPGDASEVKAVDADDQDGDGYADLVVGTASGKVFKYVGGSGGLQTPSGAFWTHPNPVKPIVGVKFGQVSGTQTGLEIVVAAGTSVHVLTGFGSSGIRIRYLGDGIWPTYPSGNAITAFGLGDVNGDGWDDVVLGTGGTKVGEIWFWENTNQGLAWTNPVQIDNLGVSILWLDLGDANKAQYMGR